MRRLTVSDLEAYLRDHDVPPNAEIRLRRTDETDVGGIAAIWDPRTQVLVLGEGDPVQSQ
jgi:hypothetical protein